MISYPDIAPDAASRLEGWTRWVNTWEPAPYDPDLYDVWAAEEHRRQDAGIDALDDAASTPTIDPLLS